ncbi:flagellar hook-associated protein FlgL [Rhodoferax sp.]|uniref:flagellar hook-associated protein FlgL n=1 Tax=Rhodoferax sp. TaxID=50421 RepID=UPI00283D60AE|nr:flagellar hook-associated protein FlgL [Rhodoferax sp.]MDR3371361.1 flagellar hook-associated protein FlgL [Rhodoferax sp.]
MSTSIRSGSANTYDASLRNILLRQADLATMQDKLTSGKKIVQASDDPTGAANAERAMTRINRIAADQRALAAQRDTITQAESTLGDVTDALQSFRSLVVSAGDGANTDADRQTIVKQLQGLRDQIFSMANQKDTNGQPLFGALGSALAPFVGPQATAPDYTFQGLPGQVASSDVSIPAALDGDSAFMLHPGRDAAFNIQTTLSASNGTARTTPVTVETAANSATAAAAGTTFKADSAYTVTIDTVGLKDPATDPNTGVATYTITGTAPDGSAVSVSGNADFNYNLPVTINIPDATNYPGQVGVQGLQINLKGDVRQGDAVTVTPVVSVFSVLDNAIRDIGSATSSANAAQPVSEALNNIDISMGRISAVRGQAGALLNRADSLSSNQDQRSTQLQADKSKAEDLDMVSAISEFQNKQTGYSAALQSYAQVQKLSLFNYLS